VSYDLYMLTPEPGVDPGETLEQLAESPAPPNADASARQIRLATALRTADPRFEQFDYEQDGVPGIELSAEPGFQVSLMPDHASISFPYWDSLDPAELSRDIARVAKLIAAETGWQLYDPQLDRFIDPERDAGKFAQAFGVGVDYAQGIASDPPAEERPSFWRRLFNRA
jgi:hypothetical protein